MTTVRRRTGRLDDELGGADERRADPARERGRLPRSVGDDPLEAVDDVVHVDEVPRALRVAGDGDRLSRQRTGSDRRK